MVNLLKPLIRKFKDVQETLPANYQDAWSVKPLLNQVSQIHWFPQPILTLLLYQTLCPIQRFQPTHSNLILQIILTLQPIQLIRSNLTLSPSRPDPSSLILNLTSDSTEARNLAPAPSSRPESAQDKFHADSTETEQLNCILSSN